MDYVIKRNGASISNNFSFYCLPRKHSCYKYTEGKKLFIIIIRINNKNKNKCNNNNKNNDSNNTFYNLLYRSF